MADYLDIQTVMSQGRQLKHERTYNGLRGQLVGHEILIGVYTAAGFDKPDLLRFPFTHAVVLDTPQEYDAWETQYRTGNKIDRRYYGYRMPQSGEEAGR